MYRSDPSVRSECRGIAPSRRPFGRWFGLTIGIEKHHEVFFLPHAQESKASFGGVPGLMRKDKESGHPLKFVLYCLGYSFPRSSAYRSPVPLRSRASVFPFPHSFVPSLSCSCFVTLSLSRLPVPYSLILPLTCPLTFLASLFSRSLSLPIYVGSVRGQEGGRVRVERVRG